MYGKFIAAFLYAVAAAVIPLATGGVNAAVGVTIAIAGVTAAGVYLIPLAPSATWTKTAVGVLLAGLNVATVVILDNAISAPEWLMIANAVLGALGITVAPAASKQSSDAAVSLGADGPVAVGWGSDKIAA
jgi:hypothetical protein